jgi:hypothetical protein
MSERVLNLSDDGDPRCPGSSLPIWHENTHWANVGEVCLLGWFDQVHITKD